MRVDWRHAPNIASNQTRESRKLITPNDALPASRTADAGEQLSARCQAEGARGGEHARQRPGDPGSKPPDQL